MSIEAVALKFPVEAHSRLTHATRARTRVRSFIRRARAYATSKDSRVRRNTRTLRRVSRRIAAIISKELEGTRRNSRGTHWNSPETGRSRRVSWRPWSPGWRGPTASRRRASRRTGTSASFSGGCCRGTGTERQDNLTNYSLAIGVTIHRERSRMIRATNQRIGSDRIDDQLTRINPRRRSRVAVRAATVNASLLTAFAKPNRKSSGRRDQPENRRTFYPRAERAIPRLTPPINANVVDVAVSLSLSLSFSLSLSLLSRCSFSLFWISGLSSSLRSLSPHSFRSTCQRYGG